MIKEAFNRNTILDKEAKQWAQEEIVMYNVGSIAFLWLWDPDPTTIGAEVFGGLSIVMLEKNGEDKMLVMESN